MQIFLVVAAFCISAAFAEFSPEKQSFYGLELAELCTESGIFPNPFDPEERTYIRCQLEPVELHCDEGFIFDIDNGWCVEEQEHKPVDLDKVNWNDYITCPSDVLDKYFRNPYDCHRFYRCYKQGGIVRMDPGTCTRSMIFDELLATCLPIDQYKTYYGHGCEALPLPIIHKHKAEPEHQSDPKPEPEPEHTEKKTVPSLKDVLEEIKDEFGLP